MKLATALCLFSVTFAACSGSADPPVAKSGSTAATPPRGSQTLPIPNSSTAPQSPARGASVGLVWESPEHWAEEAPSSNMRRTQFRVAGPEGDAECVVYYFGPGQGGDPASNATRCAKQFSQPDGRPSTDVMSVITLEGSSVAVSIVEVTGIYDGGMTGPIDAPNYMLLGGIAQGPDASWFFKFIGPEPTIRAERENFLEMMRSIRTDG